MLDIEADISVRICVWLNEALTVECFGLSKKLEKRYIKLNTPFTILPRITLIGLYEGPVCQPTSFWLDLTV